MNSHAVNNEPSLKSTPKLFSLCNHRNLERVSIKNAVKTIIKSANLT